MKRNTTVVIALMVLLGSLTMPLRVVSQTTREESGKAARVGTFDRKLLIVAYYGSDIHAEHLKALASQHADAKRAGDKTKMAKLEAQGEGEQELAHKQLAGQASIDNILEAIKPALPDIAKAAQVEVISEKPAYVSPDAAVVDVTDRLINQLNPNERARKNIDDLREKDAADAHRRKL